MPNDTTKQLTISFDNDEILATVFAKGHFLRVIELSLPEEKILWDTARAVISRFTASNPEGLAFLLRRSPRTAIQDLATLKHSTATPCIVPLSGCDSDIRQLREDAAAAASVGFTNFLAVTGALPADFTASDAAKHKAPCTFTDSLEILSALHAPSKPQTLGATVNAHKYQPETVLLNYAKMFEKLQNGAKFLVAQAGWDMAKYQELQWILQMRENMVPVIPKIRLFTPQTAQKLPQSLEPGITMPVPIAAKLMRLAGEPEQFFTYQRQLTALIAVGFRKLGFAGILIAGTNDADLIQNTLDAIGELDSETLSYDEWLAKWLAFNGDISMTPPPSLHDVPQNYYLFSNLLHRELPFFTPDASKFMQMPMTRPPRLLEARCRLLDQKNHSMAANIVKAILRKEASRMNGYALDNRSCPKRLLRFPCGNCKADGFCEADHAPCFFNQIARIAAANGDLALFED